MSKKIGIFSGSFDPIHSGHIKFALEAIENAGLEVVYFLPETLPHRKVGVTHYAHRVSMLRLALKPYSKLRVLSLPDKRFTTDRTLPRLRQRLPGSSLHLLIGSDMLTMLASSGIEEKWPNVDKFLSQVPLVVGIRDEMKVGYAYELLEFIGARGCVVNTSSSYVSSSSIRKSLASGESSQELLETIRVYIKENWLYSAVPNNS